MKKFLFYILFISVFLSCKKNTQTELFFLDEYVLGDSISYKNSIIGGLSGIDYSKGVYYFVVDDSRKPRFLKASIDINNNKIKSVDFKDVFFLDDSLSTFYRDNALDLESIFIDEETSEINLVSEGAIYNKKNPTIFKTDTLGNFIEEYQIPEIFKANSVSKPKHNGVFEGSSKSIDNKGFWVVMEAPLEVDGDEPTFTKKSSPVRITYFDKESKKATKQFAYQLEHIKKPAKGKININGVSSILEHKKNHFLITERTYQSNYGVHGNDVKIYEAYIDETTTNIIDINSLKETTFVPLKKRLIFSFEDVKSQLKEGFIDNIEGITFGPKLDNGNQSLVLVSDDNFQKFGKQINQFILLELSNK